jgi:hypothetical protein
MLLQDNFEQIVNLFDITKATITNTSTIKEYKINSTDLPILSYDIVRSRNPRCVKVTNDYWKLLQVLFDNDLKIDSRYGQACLYGVPIYIDDNIDKEYEIIWE